ncbi:MAG: MFS transporter [Pseudomonadota bacterium]
MQQKPALGFWQIWNMCFGFLGIQMGFALQNANVSRIFQTLGADTSDLALYWVAAPLTGLIVQPIVGYMSDRTWTRFGRRRPYFTVGAVLATLALLVMPNSPTLWYAVGMLWILDASINVSMEPFRAFVGDMLPERQRTAAFSMQTFFIGIGAVVGSVLPSIMTDFFGASNVAEAGEIPQSIKWAFYVGGSIFLMSVMWTVFRTREYSPKQLKEFDAARPPSHTFDDTSLRAASKYLSWGVVCIVLGAAGWYAIWRVGLDKQLFIMAGAIAAFGVLQVIVACLQNAGHTKNGVYEVVHDLFHMPRVMKQLAVVQFFSWFALFCLWVFGVSAVTSFHYGTSDPTTELFGKGANWVNWLFGAYNGVAAVAAIALPFIAHKLGCRWCHALNLAIGGLCLASFIIVKDPDWLLLPMIGVGIAWASILSLPYALLSSNLPSHKMGVYMGIFNFFIVIPQVTVAGIMGPTLDAFFDGQPIFALVIGGVLMIVAGGAALLVDKEAEPVGMMDGEPVAT